MPLPRWRPGSPSLYICSVSLLASVRLMVSGSLCLVLPVARPAFSHVRTEDDNAMADVYVRSYAMTAHVKLGGSTFVHHYQKTRLWGKNNIMWDLGMPMKRLYSFYCCSCRQAAMSPLPWFLEADTAQSVQPFVYIPSLHLSYRLSFRLLTRRLLP